MVPVERVRRKFVACSASCHRKFVADCKREKIRGWTGSGLEVEKMHRAIHRMGGRANDDLAGCEAVLKFRTV
jgi:hypothetical protein